STRAAIWPRPDPSVRTSDRRGGTSTATTIRRGGTMNLIERWAHRRFVRVARQGDQRLGAARGVRWILSYVFPDHWSFLLGEIALYSFVVLVGTGIFLTLYYI